MAQNVGRTVHQGVVTALSYRVTENSIAAGDSLTARAAWTFNDFTFNGDPTYRNNQLPGAPRHVMRTELRYRHPSGAWVAPNFETVPQGFFVDNANTTRTNPYNLFGIRRGIDFGRVSAFFDARNLGNTRYISSASVATRARGLFVAVPGGFGRAVFAGLQMRF